MINYLKLRFYSIIFIGVAFAIIGISWSFLPNEVPVFYSLPWGDSVLGSKFSLNIVPLCGMIIVGVNTLIIKLFREKYKFLSSLFTIANFVVALVVLFIVLSIITVIL